MSDGVITLLIQVPLVGIFVYFVLRMTKEYNQFLCERDDQWQKFIADSGVETVRSLSEVRRSLAELTKTVFKNSAILLSLESAVTGKVSQRDTKTLAKQLLDIPTEE